MTDDDLTRDLEAWAAATAPGADPITAAEIVDAPDVAVRSTRPRRPLLAVAAALLVVLGLGAALVVATGDDDPDEVVTDVTTVEDDGPHTQIVVHAPDLEPAWELIVHRFALIGPDGEDVTGPLLPGTSVAVDRPLAAGRWSATFLTYDCTGTVEGCGRPNVDGTPEADGEAPVRCEVPLDVPPGGGRITIDLDDVDARPGTCAVSDGSADPALTVPPAWSVRPALPWSCGNSAFDVDSRPVDDPASKREALACFAAAVEEGSAVEIPVVELVGGAVLARSWWRVLPEPIEGDRFEILRERAGDGSRTWARLLCHSVRVEEGNADVTTPEGGITGYRYIAATPLGCTDEEPLSLDLPPLAAPPPTPSSTTATTTTTATTPTERPQRPTGVDVVLDLQPGPLGEQMIEWWTLALLGQEEPELVASEAIPQGGTRTRALVADDLVVPDGARLVVQRMQLGCEGTCPVQPRAGAPDDPTVGLLSTPCSLELPATVPVVVATIDEATCSVETPYEGMPALTIPPAFSLREALPTPCGIPDMPGVDDSEDAIAGRTDDIRRCFVDAVRAGEELEMRSPKLIDEDAPDGRTWRHEDGTVTIFGHGDPVTGEGWTIQTCASMVEISEEPYMQGTGCDPVEPLPLTP